ncbi:uncharacterized protein LOC120015138 isoform X2 [Tripterygium wilfordii]|uniref:uncharacterized protein LOC120015138 isoform X2 n=1 Tax=Tripterygium wilfordii TaxID=458696 RepID=UPI0018F85011|nr:uncharacterized protein LOC120015138 isoform X2 [Tripterygium wilfordii]
MELQEFEPIIGEAKPELESSDSSPLGPFLFHVYASDSSHLKFSVTDFRSNTFEVVRSLSQLEDMRDSIGIGGSWSEFVDYIIASFKSEDVKLALERHPKSDGAAHAKLIAQKSKGMPRISISLTKLVDAAASEAVATLSLQLFKVFKSMQHLLVQEKKHPYRSMEVTSTEKEKNERIQSQLELPSKKQKLQKMNSSDRADASSTLDTKRASQDLGSTKVANRVLPAYRRARVRGAHLQDTEDDGDS